MRFTYEAPYEVDTASSAYRQYRPDFHLPDHDLYIEHFALDEAGRAPPGWRGYAEGVAWKRSLHEQHGTRLIESYSWERGRGVLRKRLREKLQAAGVRFQPMSEGEAVRELAGWQLSRLAQLLGAAIHHLKSSAATRGALEERAVRSADRRRSELFLRILHELRERYERRLREAGERDFHDLIAQAAGVLRSDRPATAYSHVLVDEFQDISQDRLRLLEALGGRGACFFLVGDDWQSVYRFTGSDVALVRGCGEHLGHVRERVLGRTFRYGPEILGPTSSFIQRNPEQIARPLRSEVSGGSGVTVVSAADPATGLRRALEEIAAGRRGADGDRGADVLVLGRYRASAAAMPRRAPAGLRLRFATVHAAKGLEADYVVVLDLADRQLGFPAQIEDDPLLELVLPQQGAGYPHAEERRLLYVAMTRARRGLCLVADRSRPSVFVRELMEHHGVRRLLGSFEEAEAPPCRRCRGGHLVEGAGGGMLCSNRPLCRYRAPRCPRCRRGSAVERDGRLNPDPPKKSARASAVGCSAVAGTMVFQRITYQPQGAPIRC